MDLLKNERKEDKRRELAKKKEVANFPKETGVRDQRVRQGNLRKEKRFEARAKQGRKKEFTVLPQKATPTPTKQVKTMFQLSQDGDSSNGNRRTLEKENT